MNITGNVSLHNTDLQEQIYTKVATAFGANIYFFPQHKISFF